MNIQVIEQEIKYTGSELAPHWIYKNFNLLGDTAVAFIGECEVKLPEMVDISDVINNEPIYSKKMLNVIIEHFNIELPEGVLRQRMLVSILKELIEKMLPDIKILRDGDDLFYENKKLTVSIATKSITSVLIHLGVNIDPEGAPVDASGLETDLNIQNIKQFAQELLENYKNEMQSVSEAVCKVRGVV